MPQEHSTTPRTDCDADVRAALRWGTRAALALVAEHILLWPRQDRWGGFRRYIPYLLGTATLGAAFAGWARERGQGRALVGAGLIAALGGAATIATYRLHAWGVRDFAREEASVGYAVAASDDTHACQ